MALLDPTFWSSGELLRATKLNELVTAIRSINARLSRRDLPPDLGDGSPLFPVTLTQTGGSNGTNSTAASWTYTVAHAITEEELATSVNPTASPHLWRRPVAGKISAATAGLAYYNADDALVITWTNETIGGAVACPTP